MTFASLLILPEGDHLFALSPSWALSKKKASHASWIACILVWILRISQYLARLQLHLTTSGVWIYREL